MGSSRGDPIFLALVCGRSFHRTLEFVNHPTEFTGGGSGNVVFQHDRHGDMRIDQLSAPRRCPPRRRCRSGSPRIFRSRPRRERPTASALAALPARAVAQATAHQWHRVVVERGADHVADIGGRPAGGVDDLDKRVIRIDVHLAVLALDRKRHPFGHAVHVHDAPGEPLRQQRALVRTERLGRGEDERDAQAPPAPTGAE